MSSVTLTILGDATGARRAIADVRADYERAAAALGGVNRRRGDDQAKAEAAARRSAAQARQRAEAAAQKQRDRDAKAEAARAKKLADQTAKDHAKAETKRTRDSEKASKARQRLADQEAKAHDRAEKRKTADAEREGRRRTRLAETEARQRARQDERRSNGRARFAGEVIRGVVTSGAGVARDLHGQYQDARRQRAATLETVAQGITQVGADPATVRQALGIITAQAREHGMTADDLASAVTAAQTEFSVLGSRAEYNRMAPGDAREAMLNRLRSTIGYAVQGRNLGVDASEFTRLAGMFSQQGVTGVEDLLSRTVAMAQRGAMSPGAVTRQAMAPVIQQMNTAMELARASAPANATPAERAARVQQAARNAYVDTFAELQILRSRGWTARRGGNSLATMSQQLTGNARAEAMRNNLRVAQRNARGPMRASLDALLSTGEGGLFEADPTQRGHFRLREAYRGRALNLGARLAEAGLDANTAANLFAGGGRGNRQSLLAPWRQLMGSLLGSDATGTRGFEAVRELSTVTLSRGEQGRMAQFFENSPLAQLNRNEEARLTALTDNTSALLQLSNRFADWQAHNPLGDAAVSGGTSLLGSLLSAATIGRLVRGGAGAGGAGASAAQALGTGAGTAAGGGLLARLGLWGAIALGSAGAGASGAAVSSGRTVAGDRISLGERAMRLAAGPFAGSLAGLVELADRFNVGRDETPARDASGIPAVRIDPSTPLTVRIDPSTPLVARIDPHDAQHAASQGAAGRNQRPGGAR